MTQPNDLSQVVREHSAAYRDPEFGYVERPSPTPTEARGEVERYTPKAGTWHGRPHASMVQYEDGDYVEHTVYATLARQLAEAEEDRATARRAAIANEQEAERLGIQLSEAKAENERLRAMLPSPPSGQRKDFTIHEWRMAAMHYESQWGAASHHCAVIQTRAEQAEAQLAQATARLAAVEGLIQQWRDGKDIDGYNAPSDARQWMRDCADELEIALKQKEPTHAPE